MESGGKEAEESRSRWLSPGFPDAEARRAPILDAMQELSSCGIGCHACTGRCCTFVANSMQVTPVELADLVDLLQERKAFTPALKDRLETNVRQFRLDVEVSDGKRGLRRSYTCPFFTPGPKGCGLSATQKPYGCLAFNARSPGVTDGQDCGSDIGILEQREEAFEAIEEVENERLRALWGLEWPKAPIPVALLAIWDQITAAEA